METNRIAICHCFLQIAMKHAIKRRYASPLKLTPHCMQIIHETLPSFIAYELQSTTPHQQTVAGLHPLRAEVKNGHVSEEGSIGVEKRSRVVATQKEKEGVDGSERGAKHLSHLKALVLSLRFQHMIVSHTLQRRIGNSTGLFSTEHTELLRMGTLRCRNGRGTEAYLEKSRG